MSKTHVDDSQQDDLDAALDNFIKTKKTQPVVTSASDGVDLFGSNVKKKSRIRRLLEYLFPEMMDQLTA